MITLEASGANPPGTYKPTRSTGNHTSTYDCSGRHADLAAAVTKLSLTDPASALDRRREGLSKVGMEPRSSALQCRERHPEGVGKHTIETNRVIS